MPDRIVVWDREGVVVPGSLRTASPGHEAREVLRGTVTLPAEIELVEQGEAGLGFDLRWFGTSSAALNGNPSKRLAPMLLRVAEGYPWLHWAAWVVSFSGELSGGLRLVGNPVQYAALQGGIAMSELVLFDRCMPMSQAHQTGILVRGRCRVNVLSPGYLGLALQGTGRGGAVFWSAVTQSRVESA
jgi:hypothetical protein